MDYCYDDCLIMFTEGQYLRASVLFNIGEYRYEMGQNALINVGPPTTVEDNYGYQHH